MSVFVTYESDFGVLFGPDFQLLFFFGAFACFGDSFLAHLLIERFGGIELGFGILFRFVVVFFFEIVVFPDGFAETGIARLVWIENHVVGDRA